MTVAVLGTGEMGTALALALARARVPVAVGSRDPARASALAARIAAEAPGARVSGADHRGAVAGADAVVLAVGFPDALRLLPALADLLPGRIVVDPTTPWDDEVPATSASRELARLLPPGAPLVAAWKTTFAAELAAARPGEPHDALLCGDDAQAKATVAALIAATGFRPLDCGGLEHAATHEGLARMMAAIARNLALPAGTVPALRLEAAGRR